MAKVTIEGLAPWDGSYELDISYFTNRELHVIKQEAGVRAGEIQDALAAGDNDVMVALTLIAAKRAGKDIPPADLWDADVGKVAFDFTDDTEEDAGPPPLTQPDAGLPVSSGSDSSPSGDSQENGQNPTGPPGSDTSVISDPVTSAI